MERARRRRDGVIADLAAPAGFRVDGRSALRQALAQMAALVDIAAESAGGMALWVPQPPLSHHVEFFWLEDGARPAHDKESVLPSGTMDLIVSLDRDMRVFDGHDAARGATFRDTVVCGARTEYVVIDAADRPATLGVHFRPGGAGPVLGLPAGALSGQHVALDALWGRAAGELHTRLLDAPGATAKFRLMERALSARLQRAAVVHPAVGPAVRALAGAPHTHTIASLVERAALSPRRFIQVFEAAVGLTPKRFARVCRFQEALRRINAGDRVDWIAIALDCGYFDQSHFIRDFRAFSGLSPSTYLTRRVEHLNHVRFDT